MRQPGPARLSLVRAVEASRPAARDLTRDQLRVESPSPRAGRGRRAAPAPRSRGFRRPPARRSCAENRRSSRVLAARRRSRRARRDHEPAPLSSRLDLEEHEGVERPQHREEDRRAGRGCARPSSRRRRRRRAPPMPKAPERPASLPECSRTRKISDHRDHLHFDHAEKGFHRRGVLAGGRRASCARSMLLEDLERLGAQLGVLAAEVLLGELARRVIELGVADLAVLGLLARLELGELGLARLLRRGLLGRRRSGRSTKTVTRRAGAGRGAPPSDGQARRPARRARARGRCAPP